MVSNGETNCHDSLCQVRSRLVRLKFYTLGEEGQFAPPFDNKTPIFGGLAPGLYILITCAFIRYTYWRDFAVVLFHVYE